MDRQTGYGFRFLRGFGVGKDEILAPDEVTVMLRLEVLGVGW